MHFHCVLLQANLSCASLTNVVQSVVLSCYSSKGMLKRPHANTHRCLTRGPRIGGLSCETPSRSTWKYAADILHVICCHSPLKTSVKIARLLTMRRQYRPTPVMWLLAIWNFRNMPVLLHFLGQGHDDRNRHLWHCDIVVGLNILSITYQRRQSVTKTGGLVLGSGVQPPCGILI